MPEISDSCLQKIRKMYYNVGGDFFLPSMLSIHSHFISDDLLHVVITCECEALLSKVMGVNIYLVNLLPLFTRETIIVTSCLLP